MPSFFAIFQICSFIDNIAEILLLAEWDTMVNHRFAMRAIEYLREHGRNALPDKIVLTFVSPEQIMML